MGGEKSSQAKSVEVHMNHPKFTNAKVETIENKKTLQAVVSCEEKEYEKWNSILEKANLNKDYLLIPNTKNYSKKGLCGSSGILTLNFDNYPYLLTEEIYNRQGKKINFEQSDLWYLLFSLISAKEEISHANYSVGDIRPQNVFINEDEEVKVSNMLSWPGERSNFSKTFQSEVTYLAPEDMKNFQMGVICDEPKDTSEIFSIGMTVLSAGILCDLSHIYNVKDYKFDFAQATQKINEWKSQAHYSEILRASVANLCQFEAQKRLTSEQLFKWISKHEYKIKGKEVFVVDNAPQKLHDEVGIIRSMLNIGNKSNVPINNPLPVNTINNQNYQGTKIQAMQAESVYTPMNQTQCTNLPPSSYNYSNNGKRNFAVTGSNDPRIVFKVEPINSSEKISERQTDSISQQNK